jgi:hypothetical protein
MSVLSKKLACALLFVFVAVSSLLGSMPALLAQWQVPLDYLPLGRGPGAAGFNSVPFSTLVPGAFPGPNDPAVGTGIATGHIVAPLDSNVVYSGNGVFPFQVAGTNPYVIGQGGTIASSTVGQIFSVRFTSAFLTGSPITVSYTAIGGDTVTAIATKLCININANTTLHNANTSLPLFCQATGSGNFNLQWRADYTDLIGASVGSGTVNLTGAQRQLDFAVSIFGRRIPGYVGQNNDNVHCLEVMGQSTSGAMDAVLSQICNTLITATAGNITGRMIFTTSLNGGAVAHMAVQNGVILYDGAGNLPAGGFIGPGRINIPSLSGNGGVYIDGGLAQMTSNGVVGPNVWGGTLAASSLNLQGANNGAASGDSVTIQTQNTLRAKVFGDGGMTLGAAPTGGSLGAGFLNVSGGVSVNNVPLLSPSNTAILTNKTLRHSRRWQRVQDQRDRDLAPSPEPARWRSRQRLPSSHRSQSPIVYGGSAAGSSLTLQSTSSGSPSGDYVSRCLPAESKRCGWCRQHDDR